LSAKRFRRYRQAFAFCWNNPLFTLPASEAWLIYEYWTVFQSPTPCARSACAPFAPTVSF
jgi:hypothetical protein